MFVRIAVGIAVVCLSAPVAHADTPDDRYIAALAAQGVTGDRGQLIADGHAACDQYGTPGVVGEMFGLQGQGLSNVQASNVVVTGVRAYCPDKSPLGPL